MPQPPFIQDDGVGIAAEDLPRIFDRGFTGCNGRLDKRATGIGLYLCRSAASCSPSSRGALCRNQAVFRQFLHSFTATRTTQARSCPSEESKRALVRSLQNRKEDEMRKNGRKPVRIDHKFSAASAARYSFPHQGNYRCGV